MTRELTRERLQNLGADYATELGRTDADVVAAVDMALALLDEREKTSVGLTVGGGLVVYGSSEAISRCQQFILLDSSHPREREDVRRILMRALQKAEKALLDLREGIETLRDELREAYRRDRYHADEQEIHGLVAGNSIADQLDALLPKPTTEKGASDAE
jgi:hypothetical protein